MIIDRSITVFIIDADDERRRRIADALGSVDEMEVLGEEAESLRAIGRATELVPDVVVAGTGGHGLVDVVRRMREQLPAAAVVIVDPDDDDTELLDAGAFSTAMSADDDLVARIAAAHRDEAVLPPSWVRHVKDGLMRVNERVRRRLLISETEREVLERAGAGEAPADIAADNEVPTRLVNLHLGYTVVKYQQALEAEEALEAHDGESG